MSAIRRVSTKSPASSSMTRQPAASLMQGSTARCEVALRRAIMPPIRNHGRSRWNARPVPRTRMYGMPYQAPQPSLHPNSLIPGPGGAGSSPSRFRMPLRGWRDAGETGFGLALVHRRCARTNRDGAPSLRPLIDPSDAKYDGSRYPFSTAGRAPPCKRSIELPPFSASDATKGDRDSKHHPDRLSIDRRRIEGGLGHHAQRFLTQPDRQTVPHHRRSPVTTRVSPSPAIEDHNGATPLSTACPVMHMVDRHTTVGPMRRA